ncbi:CaiB/BaiF CoA transferase family protein [Rhodococcus wratislaviensis]|uniref:CaiB/BaiF CoA transferase family protein n=1 Tax=Rhodococcus wratislaviensis TaxID=44752 RepID=UPI0035121CC7
MPDNVAAQRRPLEGLRVLDLTVALAGPYGTLLLAAMGAEVIKIESPGGSDIARFNPPFSNSDGGLHFGTVGDDDISLSILSRARGKKSVELDLKSAEGREIFYKMTEHADIVFENLSEGVVERLEVDYDTLRAINPRLIYCSLSGLGRPSYYPGVKAMDITVQALSGVMDTTGCSDGPPMRFGLPISDMLAPLYAVIGVQSALLQRRVTGEGQHVTVSMLECMSALLPFEHSDVLQRNGFEARSGNHHNRLAPFGIYRTRDGHVSIAAASDAWMAAIFDAIGQPELMDDPRFAGRGPRAVNADGLNVIIEDWTSQHSTDDVIAELGARRSVPCVPVRTAVEVLADQALFDRRVLEPLVHPTAGTLDAVAGGVPIHMSDADVSVGRSAHLLGADTDEVLIELAGLTEDDLAGLRAKRVI